MRGYVEGRAPRVCTPSRGGPTGRVHPSTYNHHTYNTPDPPDATFITYLLCREGHGKTAYDLDIGRNMGTNEEDSR